MNKSLLEAKLQVAQEINQVLLNCEEGRLVSAKTVGMSIQSLLNVLEEVVKLAHRAHSSEEDQDE